MFNIQNVLTSDKHIKILNAKEVKLKLIQNCSRLTPEFLAKGSINPKMRGRLIKWLITLNSDLEFKVDTLFQAVSILDHYLAVSSESAKTLQLIGATCLYISSKLLETKLMSPEVYAYSASGVFTSLDLLDTEKKILLSLNFKIDFPDAFRFLKLLRTYEGLQENEFS
jgi:transcription initiation factor TFIIIB Brf1 subunit/transcription initiation factor TFIIB